MGDTTDDDPIAGIRAPLAAPPRKSLHPTTRGAAPILGTLMLFGLTFVVAASVVSLGVAGGFVPTSATQVTWGFELEGSHVTVIHAGGPPIDGTQVRIIGSGLDRTGTLATFGPAVWERGTEGQLPIDPSASNTTVLLVWNNPLGTSIRLTSWSPPPLTTFDREVPLAAV